MADLELPQITRETTAEEFALIVAEYNRRDWSGTLQDTMGIEFVKFGYAFAVGRVPVEGNRQPAGLFHGGGHVVLAESMASMHSAMLADGHNVVGVDLNATHVRAATAGYVTAHAEVLHHGRSLINHEVRMTDDDDRLLSIVRITNMVLGSLKKY